MQFIVLLIFSLLNSVQTIAAQPAPTDSSPAGSGQEHHEHHSMSHEHHGMQMDMDGMVMNENHDQLPRDCDKLAGEQTITVHAGTKYARQFNGIIFAYDQHE